MKTPYPTMLVHAREKSPDDVVQQSKQHPRDTDRSNNNAGDLNLNKSHHQCGSFFAKCHCKYDEEQPVVGGPSSRSHPVQVPGARKKSSSPEIGKFYVIASTQSEFVTILISRNIRRNRQTTQRMPETEKSWQFITISTDQSQRFPQPSGNKLSNPRGSVQGGLPEPHPPRAPLPRNQAQTRLP